MFRKDTLGLKGIGDDSEGDIGLSGVNAVIVKALVSLVKEQEVTVLAQYIYDNIAIQDGDYINDRTDGILTDVRIDVFDANLIKLAQGIKMLMDNPS